MQTQFFMQTKRKCHRICSVSVTGHWHKRWTKTSQSCQRSRHLL